MHTLRHLFQKGGGDDLVGGIFPEVDGDEQLLSLLVDIADIDTALVGEEDPVALSRRSVVGSDDDWHDGAIAERRKSRNTKRIARLNAAAGATDWAAGFHM